MPVMFIDPPSPFATVDDWKQFLKEMQSIAEPTVEIFQLIQQAKDEIKRLQALDD